WIGWPGALDDLGPEERGQVLGKLQELRLLPIELSEEEVKGYYEGFSNRVLWPLFHYLLDHIPEEPVQWRTYAKVNERFADLVASIYREGDRIWIHDYHLCLLPKLLREAFPRAKIGFFLHIPFPAMEVLQALPWRNALLGGLLGAALVAPRSSRHAGRRSLPGPRGPLRGGPHGRRRASLRRERGRSGSRGARKTNPRGERRAGHPPRHRSAGLHQGAHASPRCA